jgi:ribosomal protein L37E
MTGKTIQCPKCKAEQPHQPICAECGFDIRAYYLKRKQAREAAGAAPGKPPQGQAPQGQKPQAIKKIKCYRCGQVQPLKPVCVYCGFDIRTHALKIRAAKEAGAPPPPPPEPLKPRQPAAAQEAPPLEPELISFEGLFRESFEAFKRRGLTVGLILLVAIVVAMIPMVLGTVAGGLLSAVLPASAQGFSVFLAICGALAGMFLLVSGIAAMIHAAMDERLEFNAAFGKGFRSFLPFLWIGILHTFITMGGYLLLVVPGVIFSIWFIFSAFIYVAEDARGMDALIMSREYVRGRGLDVFLRLLALWVISAVVGVVPIIGPLLSLAFAPFSVFYLAILYRSLKATGPFLDDYSAPTGTKAAYLGAAAAGFVIVPAIIFFTIWPQVSGLMSGMPGSLQSMEQAMEQTMEPKAMDAPPAASRPAPSGPPVADDGTIIPYEYERFRGRWIGHLSGLAGKQWTFTFNDGYQIEILAPDGGWTSGTGAVYMDIGIGPDGSVRVPPGGGLMDILVESSTLGNYHGMKAAGVYRFSGDGLTYCLTEPGTGKRPLVFETRPGWACYELRRDPSYTPPPAAQAQSPAPGSSISGAPDGAAPASGELLAKVDGRRTAFTLRTGFMSDTRMSDPTNAVLEFAVPGESEYSTNGTIIMHLDATKTGTHYADGDYAHQGWMGGYSGIGQSTQMGYVTALYYKAYGGQVFFPDGACRLEVTSAYTGAPGGVFSGVMTGCDTTSAGVQHKLTEVSFTMHGVPSH